jgi:hypothetical protein
MIFNIFTEPFGESVGTFLAQTPFPQKKQCSAILFLRSFVGRRPNYNLKTVDFD